MRCLLKVQHYLIVTQAGAASLYSSRALIQPVRQTVTELQAKLLNTIPGI